MSATVAIIADLLRHGNFTPHQAKQITEAIGLIISDIAAIQSSVNSIAAAPIVTASATSALSNESVLTAGANITLTPGAGTMTIASTGGSGGASSVKVTVDFGSSFTQFAQAVVTGEAWVTAATKFTIGLFNSSPEEAALFSFQPVVSDVVVGTGFTLSVYTPIEAKGTYDFHVIGVDS